MKKILIILALLMIMPFAFAAPQPQLELTGKQMTPTGAPWIADDQRLYFGNDKDAYLYYDEASTNKLIMYNAAALVEGASIALDSGADISATGGASDLDMGASSGKLLGPTGATNFNGNTVVTGTKTFTVNSGAVKAGGAVTANTLIVNSTSALNGATTVASSTALTVTTADMLTEGGVIIPQYWDFNVPISATSVDSNVFVPTSNWQVVAVSEVHAVAGNDGSAVTVSLTKCTGTQTPTQGAVIVATMDLKATANTITTGSVAAGSGIAKVNATERLALDFAGTPTTLAGGVVTVRLKRI